MSTVAVIALGALGSVARIASGVVLMVSNLR
jgi:hypothetical protein